MDKIEILQHAISDQCGVLYSDDGKTLLKFSASDMEYYEVKEGVETIAAGAFEGRHDIFELDFPDTLRDIGKRAFKDAHSLKVITLPEGLESIGEEAFADCSSLWHINLPYTVKTIGEGAFSSCLIVEFNTPKCLTQISDNMLANCESLEAVCISPNTASIGSGAFKGCKSLRVIVFRGCPEYISEDAFDGCKGVEKIYVKEQFLDKMSGLLPKGLNHLLRVSSRKRLISK